MPFLWGFPALQFSPYKAEEPLHKLQLLPNISKKKRFAEISFVCDRFL